MKTRLIWTLLIVFCLGGNTMAEDNIDVFSGNFVPDQAVATNESNTFATTGVWFINNGQSTLTDSTVFHLIFDDIIFDDGAGELELSAGDLNGTVVPALLSEPLVYPNPVKFSRGNSNLGYVLNTDVDVRLVIYNMFGHKIFDKNYPKGASGGAQGISNRIPINEVEMGASLPSGVYFYILLANGKDKLGKGKFAVVP
ncbi:MAG: hypothetical protein O3A01_00395 [bacterium]|nr:hypothetical protein [bacterium]